MLTLLDPALGSATPFPATGARSQPVDASGLAFPPASSRLRLPATARRWALHDLPPRLAPLLDLLDGQRTVRQVIAAAGVEPRVAATLVIDLWQAGLLVPSDRPLGQAA